MASLDRMTPARRARLEKLLSIQNLASKSTREVCEILGCGKSSLWDDLSVLRREGRLPKNFHLLDPRTAKMERLSRLRDLVEKNSEKITQGDVAKKLGFSRYAVIKGLRELRKRGEIPKGFRFLSLKEAAFLKAREKRKPQLIRLFGAGKMLTEIASEMGSNTHAIKMDVACLREAKDPAFVKAEKLRASVKPTTLDEEKRRRVERRADEVRVLEEELGRTIAEQNFLNNVHFFKSEILRILRGLPVPAQDLRTLSKLGIVKFYGKNHPPPTHYLTPAAKIALWDSGLKNPHPIKFKSPPGARA
jgi:biotin operon repressor